MIIGTVRPEEARVSDTYAGYHQFHVVDRGVEDRQAYGSFEIFWHDPRHGWMEDNDGKSMPAGWYWIARLPGCLADGEPSGPFASSRQALEDADEWNPEFDTE